MKGAVVGEFAWVLLGKVIAFIGSILLVKLLTHSMNVDGYAQLMLGLTICNFFAQILMGAAGQGIGRVYIDAVSHNDFVGFKRDILKINKNIVVFYFIVGLVAVAISVVTNNVSILPLSILLIVYSYINGLNDISGGLQNLARNRALSSIGISVDSVVKLGLVYIATKIFENVNATYIICAYLGSSSMVLMYQKTIFNKIGIMTESAKRPKDYWKDKILSIAMPASFWGIFVWLQQASDKWALQIFQNEASVSQYSILYQIGYAPFSMGMGVIMALLIPIIYSQNNNNIVNKLLAFVGLLTFLAFIVSWKFSAEILGAIVNEKYMKEAALLPYMVLAAGLYQSGDVILQQLMRENRVKTLMKIKIATALVCLFTNAIGAYLFGPSGVVGSMVLFGFLYLATLLYSKNSRNKHGVLHVS